MVGEQQSQSFLSNTRSIYLNEVNEQSAKDTIDKLLYYDSLTIESPIVLFISSFGGMLNSAFEIIDVIQNVVESDVITVVLGKAYSAGSFIACSGDVRLCFPNGEYMIHSLSAGTEGTIQDITTNAVNMLHAQQRMESLYMGLTKEQIQHLMAQDSYLTPRQAIDLGFCDHIIRKPSDLKQYFV